MHKHHSIDAALLMMCLIRLCIARDFALTSHMDAMLCSHVSVCWPWHGLFAFCVRVLLVFGPMVNFPIACLLQASIVHETVSLLQPIQNSFSTMVVNWNFDSRPDADLLSIVVPDRQDWSSLKRLLREFEEASAWVDGLCSKSEEVEKAWGACKQVLSDFVPVVRQCDLLWDIFRAKQRLLAKYSSLYESAGGIAADSRVSVTACLKDLLEAREGQELSLLSEAFVIVDRCGRLDASEVVLTETVYFDKHSEAFVVKQELGDSVAVAEPFATMCSDIVQEFFTTCKDSGDNDLIRTAFVSDLLTDLVGSWWKHVVFLQRCSYSKATGGSNDDDLLKKMSTLLPVACIKELVNTFQEVFAGRSLTPDSLDDALKRLPVVKTSLLLKQVFVLLKEEFVCMKPLELNSVGMPMQQVIGAISLYTEMAQLFTICAWVCSDGLKKGILISPKGEEGGGPEQQDPGIQAISPCIVHVAKMLLQLHRRAAKLEEQQQQETLLAGASLAIPFDDVEKALLAISGLNEAIVRTIICQAAQHAQKVGEQLEQATPRWCHIVTETAYHPKLATRQLLQSPARSTLAPLAKGLWNFLENMGYIFATLQVPETPEKNQLSSEAVVYAQKVYSSADQALTIMAGVSIVEEFAKTKEGKDAARDFLKEERHPKLPEQLAKKLRDLRDRA